MAGRGAYLSGHRSYHRRCQRFRLILNILHQHVVHVTSNLSFSTNMLHWESAWSQVGSYVMHLKNITVNSEMVAFNGYLLMVSKLVGFTRNPELLTKSLPVYMLSIVTRTFQWCQQQRVHVLSVRTFLIASSRLLLPCVSRCLNCDFMCIWLFFCQCKGSCWAFCNMVFSCCDKIDWRIYVLASQAAIYLCTKQSVNLSCLTGYNCYVTGNCKKRNLMDKHSLKTRNGKWNIELLPFYALYHILQSGHLASVAKNVCMGVCTCSLCTGASYTLRTPIMSKDRFCSSLIAAMFWTLDVLFPLRWMPMHLPCCRENAGCSSKWFPFLLVHPCLNWRSLFWNETTISDVEAADQSQMSGSLVGSGRCLPSAECG